MAEQRRRKSWPCCWAAAWQCSVSACRTACSVFSATQTGTPRLLTLLRLAPPCCCSLGPVIELEAPPGFVVGACGTAAGKWVQATVNVNSVPTPPSAGSVQFNIQGVLDTPNQPFVGAQVSGGCALCKLGPSAADP